jgi:inositol hexakisphosphate/diphosphoinositol-pentakisphosphate kinase
MFFLGLANVV